MRNDHRSIILALILFLILCLYGLYIANEALSYKYVRGKYGEYCYKINSENDNIKHKILFKTLADCGKPLKILKEYE